MSDRITLPNALFQALLPQNTWTVSPPPDKTHFSLAPLCVSLSFSTSLATAGSSDDVQHTLSYSQLYKNAQSVVCDGQQSDVKQFPGGIRQVAREIAEKTWEDCPAASKKDKCTALQVTVEQPKSLLQARTLFVQHTRRSATTEETVGIKGYRIQTVIGVWKHERHQPQPMELDVYATLQPEATWKADAMLSVIDKVCLYLYITHCPEKIEQI